jgi:hypothetical protein
MSHCHEVMLTCKQLQFHSVYGHVVTAVLGTVLIYQLPVLPCVAFDALYPVLMIVFAPL